MRNAPRTSPDTTPVASSRPGGVFDRRSAIQAGLASLLCLSIPGDGKIERREALTPRQIVESLLGQGIQGARTVQAPVVPGDYRHVFLHIPQRHQVMFMDAIMRRAVQASQGDIETMLFDLRRRFDLRDVYPENMVPKNLEDSRLFAHRENPEQEFLDAIARQRSFLEEARRHGPPEHAREMEALSQKHIAEFERELALIRKLGKDGYNKLKFDRLQQSDAEFDAPLRMELAGGIRRKMCGTDAALTRAGDMRRAHGLKHPAVLDEREDDAIRVILSQADHPLLAVPYGSAHDFTNNIQAHNARHPDKAMALVVAEPLSHAVIRLPAE